MTNSNLSIKQKRYIFLPFYLNYAPLLYIKAFALSNFEARELLSKDEKKYAKGTSFEKEMELLLFDM